MTDLDTLLSAPLASVDDAGFSARVMQYVASEKTFARGTRDILELSALLVAAGLFLLAIPLAELNNAIEYITLNMSSSLPIGVAVGVIVLTTTWLHSTEPG